MNGKLLARSPSAQLESSQLRGFGCKGVSLSHVPDGSYRPRVSTCRVCQTSVLVSAITCKNDLEKRYGQHSSLSLVDISFDDLKRYTTVSYTVSKP